jgi:transcription antitermination factor NusG
MDMETSPVATEYPWYAVHVRTKYEKRVADALTGKGYACLLPSYRERRNWSDRTKTLELPLFPGYVFSRFDVEVRLPILTTPGVLAVAGVGRTPQALDEGEVEQVRRVTATGYPAQPWPYLGIGQRVRITAGPLTGVEGLLLQRRGETRVVLSLTHLEKSISVMVESDAVRPL